MDDKELLELLLSRYDKYDDIHSIRERLYKRVLAEISKITYDVAVDMAPVLKQRGINRARAMKQVERFVGDFMDDLFDRQFKKLFNDSYFKNLKGTGIYR